MTTRRSHDLSSATRPESRRQPRTPPRGRDAQAWGDWLDRHEWSFFVTLTTAADTPFSADALKKAFFAYADVLDARLGGKRVAWFVAVEGLRAPQRPHLHALLYGPDTLAIRALRGAWRYGHVEAKRFDPRRGAAWYVTKEIGSDADEYHVSDIFPPERSMPTAARDAAETPIENPPTLTLAKGRPTRLDEIVARWETRRNEGESLGSTVTLANVAAAVLADLALLRSDADAETVTLAEGARRSGYSADHLQRLVADGKIPNVGRKGRPRIRVVDLPKKPGRGLRAVSEDGQFSARRQVVAAVVTGKTA